MTDPQVAMVFDTSAIVSFTRPSIHVGEVLAEIAAENRVAVLPTACLGAR